MRESGYFSNWVLGRKYGRDYAEFEQKPNAVVVVSDLQENKSVRSTCLENFVPYYNVTQRENDLSLLQSVVDKTKSALKKRYVESWGTDRYQEGLTAGKSDAARSCQRDIQDAIESCESEKRMVYKNAYDTGYRKGRTDERNGVAEPIETAQSNKH